MLRAAGLDCSRIEIIGADISARCLADARLGLYSPNALRRTSEMARERWFRVGKNSVKLDPAITRMVQYRQHNLMHDNWSGLGGSFDLVFCENVLIYFDQKTIQQVLQKIKQMMTVDGWLFVDHAEWSLPSDLFHLHAVNNVSGFKLSAPLKPQRRSPAVDAATKAPAADDSIAVLNTTQAQPTRLKSPVKASSQATLSIDHQLQKAFSFYQHKQFIEAAALMAMLLNKKGILVEAKKYFHKVEAIDPQHPVLKLR